jgi:hypothetical protein
LWGSGRLDEAKEAWQKALAAYQETGDTHSAGIVTDWLSNLPQ